MTDLCSQWHYHLSDIKGLVTELTLNPKLIQGYFNFIALVTERYLVGF